MTPRPQLSLCIPVDSVKGADDAGLIQEFVENVSQFFQKFPLLYEVLFSVNPNQDQSLSLLQYQAERNPHYRIVENKSKLSRAQNICNLFSQARGDVLIATDLDLAAPLSEVFKMLEVFYSDKETEVVPQYPSNPPVVKKKVPFLKQGNSSVKPLFCFVY